MLFCDWLTCVSMPSLGIGTVPDTVPPFHGGFVHRFNEEAELQGIGFQPGKIQGSFSTAIMVNTCPPLYQVSGNPSRWSRTDNLFGYSVKDCITRVRAIAAAHGIEGIPLDNWRLTRVDLTRNYSTGSLDNARAWLGWLAGQKAGRIKANSYGDGTTVMWRSKRWTAKAYLKSAEIRKHKGNLAVADYCEQNGVVRLELTLRGEILRQNRVRNVKAASELPPEHWETLWEKYMADVLQSITVDQINDMPVAILGTFLAWQQGVDVSARMSRASFYRHRKQILSMQGVDISLPCNVQRLNTKPRVIEITPLDVPDWYQLDEPHLVEVAND